MTRSPIELSWTAKNTHYPHRPAIALNNKIPTPTHQNSLRYSCESFDTYITSCLAWVLLALYVVFMIISQNVGGVISRSQEHDLILSHSFGSPSTPDQVSTWVLFPNTHLETTLNLVDLEISFGLAACKK